MRLGKKKEKEKESESKSQVVEGINRLVCQAKTHHSLLKGNRLIELLKLIELVRAVDESHWVRDWTWGVWEGSTNDAIDQM